MTGRSRFARLLFLWGFALAALVPVRGGVLLSLAVPVAMAREPLQATTTAPRSAEVDEPFVIELRVTSEEVPMRAEAPSLTPPIGLVVGRPSVSFFTNSVTINGTRKEQAEYRARWTIRASEPGRYAFEAPSVTVRGQRVRGNPVTVDVVPATPGGGGGSRTRPQRGSRFQFSWPFGSNGIDDDEPSLDDEPSGNLSLPEAPPGKDILFLRAVADKTRVYVGEQVTLSFYLYFRVSEVEWTDKTEAPLRDFLRIPLMRDPGTSGTSPVRVGPRRWMVKLLDRAAIFPLRAGSLATGTMTARFRGRRIGAKVLEESNDLTIEAIEPPEAGRPPGYAVGDVGRFDVDADVRPRDLDVGDMVTVTLQVKGTGNPPTTVRMPELAGIEWLDPDRSFEQVVRSGKVGGVRTFKFLGKVSRGGYVPLGPVEIPFWDPDQKAYAVAKADLGGLRVKGSTPPPDPAAGAAPDAPEGDALAELPPPRPQLGAFARAPEASVPLRPFLAGLAAPPLLVVLGFVGARALRATRKRAAERRDAPLAKVHEALAAAREGDVAGDTQVVAAAVERAVHAAVFASTGVMSRGARLEALPDELVAAGLGRGLADRASALLRDAEVLRFDPTAAAAGRTALVDRARALAKELASAGSTG